MLHIAQEVAQTVNLQTRDGVFSLIGPTQRLEEPAVKTVSDLLSKMCDLILSVALVVS